MNIEHSTPASVPELGSEEKKSLAVRAVMIMANGDRAAFDEVVAEDAVNHEAKSEPPAARVHGPEGFFATALWLRDAFADLKFEVSNVVEQDGLVVVEAVMSGRHEGLFATYDEYGRVDQVFAPTGKSFSVRQAHWLRVTGGKVVEHWAVRDDLGMATQAGWVPPNPVSLVRNILAARKLRKRIRADRS
ncbi:ester cyclase [Rhodococcus sp. B50]|uniref:ester cyclase n=1 Tax=Rhodococcus sp. B50 TaxID=2682847 RepID=UPI001BD1C26D|nr:ester cyclase [Rhodococcus sp. B50]MBS9375502.1 Aklanonic acid methyl ester cyclase DauD [Rhodococcus sp. B50]